MLSNIFGVGGGAKVETLMEESTRKHDGAMRWPFSETALEDGCNSWITAACLGTWFTPSHMKMNSSRVVGCNNELVQMTPHYMIRNLESITIQIKKQKT